MIYVTHMNESWHVSFTWWIFMSRMRDITHLQDGIFFPTYESVMSHLPNRRAVHVVWHDSVICVMWLIYMCDMTHSQDEFWFEHWPFFYRHLWWTGVNPPLFFKGCIVLQWSGTQCNSLQHTATHRHIWRTGANSKLLQHNATRCKHTATHCSILQYTATYCSTLQHLCGSLLHTTPQ